MENRKKSIIAGSDPQVTQSAYNYNPMYQKRTQLTWNAPSGGYHYYGPPPDMGTSYGMWWDAAGNFGVMAPVPDNGTLVYSPATGDEMSYQGPASTDAVYALLNYKGSYEFMPPTRAGDTCLTTAPIFSPDVETSEMYHPFSGAEITQEYQTMKANRTAQPAVKTSTASVTKLTPHIIDAMTEEELSDNLLAMLSKAAEGDEDAEAPEPAPPAKTEKSEAPPAEKSAPAEPEKSEAPPPEAPAAEKPEAPPAPPKEEAPPSPPKEEAVPPSPPKEEAAPPAPEAPTGGPASQEAPPPAAEPVNEAPKPENSLAPQVQPELAPPSPEAPAPEVPSVQKEEPPTPTTKNTQGVESMTTSAQVSKDMKALALKLLSDPDYMTKNPEQVKAMVEQANAIIEAAKSGKEGGSGFYSKDKVKALEEAQRKAKLDGDGFYSETLEEARKKAVKEIEKVSAMIDDKILAALGGMEDSPPEAPASAKDAFKLEGNDEDMSPLTEEDMEEMGAAMAEIEMALQSMGASKSKSKSKKHEEEMEHKSKSKSKGKSHSAEAEATTDADYANLKAEIEQLEAALREGAEEEPMMEAPMGAGAAEEAPAPAAEPAASPPPEAPKSEPAAEGVAVEMVASVEEIEADGPVMASAVEMSLYGEQGLNPFWNITANGEPIGRVYLQDQADPSGDRSFFTSAKYVQGVSQAIEKVGLKDTLTSIKAKFFANRIERSDVVRKIQGEADKVIKATVAQKTSSLRDELVGRMVVAQSALDKNMFKDEGNALKDAMYIQMQKFGVNNPVPYIEAAFEQGSADYFKLILAKAVEFLDMEPKAFEQIKKTVANSDVLTPPDEGMDNDRVIAEAQATTLSAHLMNNNMPLTFSHTLPATSSYASLKDNLRMGLSLKKTV